MNDRAAYAESGRRNIVNVYRHGSSFYPMDHRPVGPAARRRPALPIAESPAQCHPFVLAAADLPRPDQPLVGARSIHDLFKSWLAEVQGGAVGSGAADVGGRGQTDG